ncbi:hypothetical protein M3Y99_00457100 [Aphelenchoides fujianensis]|nr:hypothetical protein M3Y99_00457100 [Aphelenchoides fujianensis]
MDGSPKQPVCALSVLHFDRTDTIVPAALSAEEQRVSMSRVAKQPESGGHPASRQEPVGFLHPLPPRLLRLVRNGRRQFAFDYAELTDVLERAAGVCAAESSLLEVPVPCVVYGDLHRWPPVFLGDFVDRGDARPRCTATRCSPAPGYKGSRPKDVNTGACLEIAANARVSVSAAAGERRLRRLRAKRSRKQSPRFVEEKTVQL